MLLPLVGLLVGVLAGLILNVNVSFEFSRYSAVAILAALDSFIGDRLNIDLYLVALINFGFRIFNNVALIRRHFI